MKQVCNIIDIFINAEKNELLYFIKGKSRIMQGKVSLLQSPGDSHSITSHTPLFVHSHKHE